MLLASSASNPANSITVIAERVRGEFREMPGLTLTIAQARRLWSLDPSTCSEVLSQLVAAGFLSRRDDGTFCRATDLATRPPRMAKAFVDHERRRFAEA